MHTENAGRKQPSAPLPPRARVRAEPLPASRRKRGNGPGWGGPANGEGWGGPAAGCGWGGPARGASPKRPPAPFTSETAALARQLRDTPETIVRRQRREAQATAAMLALLRIALKPGVNELLAVRACVAVLNHAEGRPTKRRAG